MAETFMSWAKEAKNKKYVFLIILLILLIILLTFYPVGKNNNNKTQTIVKTESSRNTQASYEDKLENKLKVILSQMEGVGAVDVMVTIDSTEEKVIAQNIKSTQQRTDEKDQQGGTRVNTQSQNNTDVVLQNGNVPYVTKENAPEIKGVFILAEGADNSEVKAEITEAVSKVLDVPVHKISVGKKKN